MMAGWSVVGIMIGDGFQTAEGRSLKTGPDLHSLGGGGCSLNFRLLSYEGDDSPA